jgi:hypothetical protein
VILSVRIKLRNTLRKLLVKNSAVRTAEQNCNALPLTFVWWKLSPGTGHDLQVVDLCKLVQIVSAILYRSQHNALKIKIVVSCS